MSRNYGIKGIERQVELIDWERKHVIIDQVEYIDALNIFEKLLMHERVSEVEFFIGKEIQSQFLVRAFVYIASDNHSPESQETCSLEQAAFESFLRFHKKDLIDYKK